MNVPIGKITVKGNINLFYKKKKNSKKKKILISFYYN